MSSVWEMFLTIFLLTFYTSFVILVWRAAAFLKEKTLALKFNRAMQQRFRND